MCIKNEGFYIKYDSFAAPTIVNHAGGVQQPLITLANGTLAYAAPNAAGRSNMTVFTSVDDGNSWAVATSIYRGPSAYSALAEKADSGVLLAYCQHKCQLLFGFSIGELPLNNGDFRLKSG